MDLSLSKLKQWRAARRVAKFYGLNYTQLHREIYPEIFLEKNQISSWFDRFIHDPNPLHHPYVEIAQLYTNAARHERAAEFYMRFLNKVEDPLVHALYLQNLLLSETASNHSLLLAHQQFANLYDDPRKRLHWQKKKFDQQKTKKLKVGYVCHFFANSISDSCLLPFLKLHNRELFSVYCYDDGETPIEHRSAADVWRDIRGYTDEKVAKLIEEDGIDILQELNGFCLINRFGALAYRPAPIQINWYNHTGTTGLPYIDYIMSDQHSILPSDRAYFVESTYLTPQFIAAKAIDLNEYGAIAEVSPCTRNNSVTFGYFGSSHKITLQAIRLWSRVLTHVPHSKFVLKSGSFSHPIFRKIFLKHFLHFGIDGDRIEFRGWSNHKDTVSQYNDIDLMLDNAPVTGGSTLFEALTQSVPTVSLLGDRWAARSGASVLTALKHSELIAKNEDEYVKLAVRLAEDVGALNAYRRMLRDEMMASNLSNIKHFYKNFETAYQNMWRTWCEQKT